MSYLGDFPVDGMVYIPFHTFNSSGASVTLTGLAVTDIEVYKDGSTTQRSSDAGYTLLDTDGIDFDGITGIHGFKIDLSDNTDAGFWAAGHEYMVVVASVTVDSQTVNFVAAEFSIERAGGALALLKNGTYGLSAIESLVDDIGAAGAGLTAIPWNAAWDAEVESEVDDALVAYDPPTNAEMEARTLVAASYFDPASDTVDVGKISGDSAAADNLEAMLDGTGGVDLDLKQLHLTGGAGPGLLITSSAVGGGAVKIESTAPVAGIGIDIDAAGGSGVGIDVDGGTSGIDTRGADGYGVYANGGATGTGIGAVGTTGINAIGTTNDIIGDITGNLSGSVGSVDAGGITAASIATNAIDADALAADAVTEIQSGLALEATAQSILTDTGTTLDTVLDNIYALLTNNRAEPGQGAPAASLDPLTKLDYLYKSWRNKKTQTATTRSIYNDAGDTVDQKGTDSDDGTTFTKGEIGTGA